LNAPLVLYAASDIEAAIALGLVGACEPAAETVPA
jgi:hypothetical protein